MPAQTPMVWVNMVFHRSRGQIHLNKVEVEVEAWGYAVDLELVAKITSGIHQEVPGVLAQRLRAEEAEQPVRAYVREYELQTDTTTLTTNAIVVGTGMMLGTAAKLAIEATAIVERVVTANAPASANAPAAPTPPTNGRKRSTRKRSGGATAS